MNIRLRISDNQAGFSLLEALVALVLLAGFGIALYGWINTSLIGMSRSLEVSRQDLALQQVREFLKTLNPMQRPRGEEVLGSLRITWEADALEPVRDGYSSYGGLGNYRLGLYQLQVRVAEDGLIWDEFTMRQVGYEQVRTKNPFQ